MHAVNGVSFSIDAGRTVGLVGESGSGKSTIARCIVRLTDPTAGTINLDGEEITTLDRRDFRPYRAKIQMVFQDPMASLNPRMRVGSLVEEPLRFFTSKSSAERLKRVAHLFDLVGLSASHIQRFPHQLSGGQQQRVAIARAIASEPRLIVLDEPTSALDMSLRWGVIELLKDLQRELGLAYLLISHDLTTVRALSGELIVLYVGRVVESGGTGRILDDPSHPYTMGLMASRLVADPIAAPPVVQLTGEIPSAINLPAGCALASRCPEVDRRCWTERPPLRQLSTTSALHRVACLRRPVHLDST